METIFISIASYRDHELEKTVRDCLRKAMHPERLVFGIHWQHDNHEFFEHTFDRRFRVIDTYYTLSKGQCWARSEAQKLYAGEDFVLQIDSHTRFVPDWDEISIHGIRELQQEGNNKVIISNLAPGYDPADDGNLCDVSLSSDFHGFTAEGYIGLTWSRKNTSDRFSRGRSISGHFLFSIGDLYREVKIDPNLYFYGSEITYAVRAFTYGYDLYSSNRPIVYHYYERKGQRRHWTDHHRWYEKDLAAKSRMRTLLMGTGESPDLGRYGLGTSRTLADYEEYAGVDFKKRIVKNFKNRIAGKSTANTIFVQIASYRDFQLIPTINDMLANAKRPGDLHISVCWQHGPDETLEMFTSNGFVVGETVNDVRIHGLSLVSMMKEDAELSVIDVQFLETKGACWARNTLQQLYNGEKYTLQLDSHHRFTRHWDETLINMLESVRTKETPKPLLTAYAPSFDPVNDPSSRAKEPWKMDFDRFIPEGAVFFVPSRIDNWQQLNRPIPARFYSAHFAFADGSFAVEVQHDPEYFFHGEEISIGVRAFTHGYDLFHPHRVVLWHEFTRRNRVKVWDDHTTSQKNDGNVELDWVERNNHSHRRNRILFGMDGEDPNQMEFGKYGFGRARSLRQYEEYAGISFAYRGVQQLTLNRSPNHHYPPNDIRYGSEEEWKATFVRSNDIGISVHRNELKLKEHFGDDQPDFDFFYVGVHDQEGKEIFRKDLQEHEIKRYLQHDWINYRFIFFDNRRAVTYTIWTHSRSKGWLTKIDKPIRDGGSP